MGIHYTNRFVKLVDNYAYWHCQVGIVTYHYCFIEVALKAVKQKIRSQVDVRAFFFRELHMNTLWSRIRRSTLWIRQWKLSTQVLL